MAGKPLLASWRADLPASIVVSLIALPLCLGVALASGAPLFSGLIAGIAGGLVVGAVSKSPLSVSGPAAGLTVIVLAAIEGLPSYQAFLAAVAIAGVLQILFAVTKAGVASEFIPSAVITGMLAAIGLTLILKQIPHAVGYDAEAEGSLEFLGPDGANTFSEIVFAVQNNLTIGAVLIAAISLAFLFWWDKAKPKEGPLRFVPGPLVVVAFGVAANAAFKAFAPGLAIQPSHLVNVPVAHSVSEFTSFFTFPDFSAVASMKTWTVGLTLAIVASLESMLSVKAVDDLDPQRRVTDKNRELFAQGCGNLVSALFGGIPVTSVIVRSSANVEARAESKMSTIMHGGWLLLSVAFIPTVLNLIPLSALAAVLIATGYKLTKPALFFQRYAQGWTQFVPFVVTTVAIVFTDLLIGIGIGLGVGFAFAIGRNFHRSLTFAREGDDCLIRARRNLYFMHKYELQYVLSQVPDNANVLIDLSATNYVDLDNIDIINAFTKGASYRGITLLIRGDVANRTAPLLAAPKLQVAFS